MGVSGKRRVTPASSSTSLQTTAIEIAARHEIEPYQQSPLDALCGVHAAINSLRLVCYRHAPLTKAGAKRLWEAAADFLDSKGGAGEAMWAGMEVRRWHALVRKLAKHASTNDFTIDVERPDFASDTAASEVFDWIDISLAENKPVLVHLDGTLNHFSVIAGSTPTRLELFDSAGHKFVMRSSCGVKRGFHIIRPKALLRLAVRPR